jgi:RimJ/RimL family protein N-acetyltransferase
VESDIISLTASLLSLLIAGPILGGRPEARYEAYARAYAGCGLNTTTTYRRSYARMYEALCCATHASDDKFRELFESRPQDIVGRFVRLEALEKERHLKDFYDATCGDMYMEHPEYDPSKVWGFLEYGPFDSKEKMARSPLFEREVGKAAFAIIDNVTDRLVGMVMLTNDDPKNLNIHMEPPIMKPKSTGAPEQLEACFLLMDRLFALGYRRLNMLTDSQDVEARKLPGRLGMTQEGLLPKHMIIKEANRDSAVYGMLNSDWDKGARAALFKKLYGKTAEQVDATNAARETEAEEQERKLKLLKAQEKEAAAKKKV